MRRIFPPKTKRASTLYKDFTYKDLCICFLCLLIAATTVSSNFSVLVVRLLLALLILLCALALCLPYGHFYRGYDWLIIMRSYAFSKRSYSSVQLKSLFDYKPIEEGVELIGTSVAILELCPIEFLLFNQSKQEQLVAQFALALREIKSGSIIKVERPIDYGAYIERYQEGIKTLTSERQAFIAAEREKAVRQHKAFDESKCDVTSFNARIDILEKNVIFLQYVNTERRINAEVFYLAIYEKSGEQLKATVSSAISRLSMLGLMPRRISSDEITELMQYFIYKKSADTFEMPNVSVKKRSVFLNEEEWHIAAIGKYPVFAEGNHWASNLFTIPETNVVVNFGTANREQVIKSVNKSIKEIRYRFTSQKEASGQQDLQIQLEALKVLLQQFQLGNEGIHNANVYIMYQTAQEDKVRQVFGEQGFILNKLTFMQFEGFASMLPICGKDLLPTCSRHLQSTTLAAAFPFINNLFMDRQGNYLGDFRYPVFWDMWERAPVNKNRVNSNLCIIGTSGGGKTFLQKKVLMQQRVQSTKVFVLDCEQEYNYMAGKLGGQVIEMAGGSRINPFQIYSSFDVSEDEMLQSGYVAPKSGDVSAQCSFLSEWFKSILSMDINCKSMLDTCIAEMYAQEGIDDMTDFSKLKEKDFPTFDTLFKVIGEKKKSKRLSSYEIETLQKIENYMQLFVGKGIYARLWNGATTLNIKNDFIVFDFQQLFANSNTEICNAQMMLLMRLLMREVINVKNENAATGRRNRVIVLVDEAHRYISTQFPIALDTLEQFARRIRKYDGALIVATQNIKDFVGSSEVMKAKASAVINNCQYSMLFGLKADDINDVRQLYANYGGGLTVEELNFLGTAERGQMLFLVEPEKRSIVQVGLMPDEKAYIERATV